MAVTPDGVITGFGCGAASTKDQPLATTFFAVRHTPHVRLPSVGQAAAGPYVVDTGFEGADNHDMWTTHYQARVICPPRRTTYHPWSKAWQRWHASVALIYIGDKW